MGKLIWLCPIRSLLFVLFFLSVVDSFLSLSSSSVNPTPLCLPEDTSALLQFDNTLFIDESAHDLCAYPKTKSWNESTNCCTWEGVTCNKVTGQVISLDLSCSMLTGSLSPNTSLFRLQGLKRLDLSFNNFSGSIPSGFSQLVTSLAPIGVVTSSTLTLMIINLEGQFLHPLETSQKSPFWIYLIMNSKVNFPLHFSALNSLLI
ncbi:hypothetical protein ES332_A01G065100v1 [Gossypium tomentosum]|uniref:Leucine-rich repeat-containing N-terminal plant-type domain-containing protein n=1 Tax=Gossypium tomentosum TaxID=34277 RepID=A0A5D2RNB4_GOSTO|nr:hypothetical protein ES332_A01G065100v1 [Gossypium tomentosum]